MKTTIMIEKEVNIKTLLVDAQVRYWEDASVNGKEDLEGKLIPCREGENWKPKIDFDSGKILNWEKGKKADIHYKVCDAGIYILLDENDNEVLRREGYVINMMCPNGGGYGDYIIMKIDSEGQIQNWRADIEDFGSENY